MGQRDEETWTTATLWGVDDIAAYYGRSRKKAYAIVKTPGFPSTVRGDAHRWVAAKVRDWAERADEALAEPTVLEHARAQTPRIVRRKAA